MRKLSTVLAVAFGISVLTGCKTTGDDQESVFGAVGGALLGGIVGNQIGSGTGRVVATIAGAAVGAWLGSKFAEILNQQDQENLANSTQLAAVSGFTQTWENPDTGVRGTTRVNETKTTTKPTQVRFLKDRVQETPPIEFINQPYVVLQNSNVRGGPGTDYVVVDSLKGNEKTMVLGKVEGEDWYLISKNNVGAGYVFGSLLKPAPDEAIIVEEEDPALSDDIVEVTIASGQTCRIVTQEIVLPDGTAENDEVTVCNGPNGWVVT